MDKLVRASAVWREALAIVVRHPVATVGPALFLAPLTESPHLLSEHRSTLEVASVFVVESFAFYLYVAYAERLTSEARRSPEPISVLRVLRNLLLAAPVVPVVAVASLAAIALPTASASLVVVPGIWVMTRWSLFAPVIVTELLGPLAALKRSNELVRGNFELVFLTAAFAVVLEEAVADAGTLGGLELTGSETWGQWLGGSVATIGILPVASFATALVYGHLRRVEDSSRSRSGRP
jgi:hypothetical protein